MMSKQTIEHRTIGHSTINVSVVGFGCWGIGGITQGATSYGATDDSTSLAALSRSLEQGITLFDTAPAYGSGHSEELLGQAFHGAIRDRVVIATKGGCDRFDSPPDYSVTALNRGLENSLRRLNTDYVDLFQLHNPPASLIRTPDDLLRMSDDMKKKGQIKVFGLSVSQPEDGLLALEHLKPDVIQVNFNLVDQRADTIGLLDAAHKAGTSIIARTPLCFGFLTGRVSAEDLFSSDDHRSRWSAEQRALWVEGGRKLVNAVSARTDATPAQLALQFCLWHPAIAATIPGMLTAQEVDENAAAGTLPPLGLDDIAALRALYAQETFFVTNKPRTDTLKQGLVR